MSLRSDLSRIAKEFRWGRHAIHPTNLGLPQLPERTFPTAWARSTLGRAAREVILRAGFKPLLSSELTISIEGTDVLDEINPPAIFIANHSSHIDAPLILTSLPLSWQRRTCVGAAADYFFDVWWRAAATALAFNAFPVERGGARKTLGHARALMDDGWSLLVFPEGTRSKDGWMGPFKQGTALLAMGTRVPVVPIGITGAHQAMPKGRGWPLPGRPQVNLRFGKPIYALPDERARDLSARMRAGLEAALHEDATDWWTARRASIEGATPAATGPDGPSWKRLWESSRPVKRRSGFRVWE